MNLPGVCQVIYNEGWGQLRNPPYPEEALTEVVRKLDPTRLIDSVTGWFDHGFGDFSVSLFPHEFQDDQQLTPSKRIITTTVLRNAARRSTLLHLPRMIQSASAFRGSLGESATTFPPTSKSQLPSGHAAYVHMPAHVASLLTALTRFSLWKVQKSIDEINQTYELDADLDAYNYRAGSIFRELREQVERYACSGGVWTQTTDVEGEVNGLYTYDRRVLRPYVQQWKDDIESLYHAARARGGRSNRGRGSSRASMPLPGDDY